MERETGGGAGQGLAPGSAPTGGAWRPGRLARFYQRFHVGVLVALGMLVAFAAVIAYRAIWPLPAPPTESQFNAEVARALAALPPKPADGAIAYQVIRPSLVTVLAAFPQGGAAAKEAEGAGVAISESGTILTSLHVVQGANAVTVVFADGSQSPAEVVAEKPENDLAVLSAEVIPDDLVPATLASSATLSPGDEVFAVGNPFGLGGSVSAGVVSGLDRQYTSTGTGPTIKGLIQFDAAVNPGNSGGPLVDRSGEVVGIVMGLLNPTEQRVFIGIGFAVPIETAAAAAGAPWW